MFQVNDTAERVTDPNRRFFKIFHMGYFVTLCVVGVFCFYLAPSNLGQIDNIYTVETNLVKIAGKSGKVQQESNENANFFLYKVK